MPVRRPLIAAATLVVPCLFVACTRGSSTSLDPGASGASASSVDAGWPAELDASSDVTDAAEVLDAPFDLRAWQRQDIDRHRFIVYVPTPHRLVDKMLQVAKLKSTDVLYDLGCGDGRILIAAAKKGAKAVGFDIDPARIAEARENVARAGVESLVTLERADVLTVDLTPATVVTMYLSPRVIEKLVPHLEKLAPGTRIVSHDYPIKGALTDGYWETTGPFFGRMNELWEAGVSEDSPRYARVEHDIFLWVTPLEWVDAGAEGGVAH
jgi:SAM-dependent methyltransferase